MANCGICKRELDQPDDPLSGNCGGDCWGCVSEVEAEGMGLSVEEYRNDPGGCYGRYSSSQANDGR